jgi:hypothetical protein
MNSNRIIRRAQTDSFPRGDACPAFEVAWPVLIPACDVRFREHLASL